MENRNSNNSKCLIVRTESCVPTIPRNCVNVSKDERTLLENHVINVTDDCPNSEEDVIKKADDGMEEKSKRLTRRQKLTFLGIAIVSTTDVMLYSVLAPFFPIEAMKKNISPTVSGLVFGVFALVMFVASPIFGKYVSKLGPKFLFISGTFLCAGSNILFGVLDEIEDSRTFIIYCFILRSVEAVGGAAAITASMTIMATVFPDRVAQMAGIVEMFSGVGLMVGPAVGGLLYKIGGYKLPFLVLGAVDLVALGATMFILPDLKMTEEEAKPGSLMKFLMIPAVWPMSLGLVVASAAMTFLDPTLTLHLESFGVSAPLAGVMFLLIGGLYAVTMPIWGYLADKKGRTRLMTLLGFYLLGLANMLLGPSPLLNLPHDLWIVVVSLSLIGLSIGCACMPIFLDMMQSARLYGLPDDASTNGLVSGVFGGCFSLGNFLGPVLGGVLKEELGFNWASTYIAASCFAFVLIFGLFCIWEYRCGKGRRKPWYNLGNLAKDQNDNMSDVGSLMDSGASTRPHADDDVDSLPRINGSIKSYPISIDGYLEDVPAIDVESEAEPLVVNA